MRTRKYRRTSYDSEPTEKMQNNEHPGTSQSREPPGRVQDKEPHVNESLNESTVQRKLSGVKSGIKHVALGIYFNFFQSSSFN